MEKKELVEKTNEIKESAVKLFKQVDSYLGFNGRVSVIFGLAVITMLSMILDRVDGRDDFRWSDRNESRQMRDSFKDNRKSQRNGFYGWNESNQESQRWCKMMGDDFDQAFQQMDQMRSQMRNQMQGMMQNNQAAQWREVNVQNDQSESFFGNMKNKIQSFFGQNQPNQAPQDQQTQTRPEVSPSISSQRVSVSNGSTQYTINDENGQVSGTITLAKESLAKVDAAIQALGLSTTSKDSTISFSGKLNDINSLLQVLESN